MTQKIVQCPFCGSTRLKAYDHSTRSGLNRHSNVFIRCQKCGCHGPSVKTPNYDRRDHPSDAWLEEFKQKAMEKFSQRAETKINENEPFKLEWMQ